MMDGDAESRDSADTLTVGKFWAAVRGQSVVGLISMSVPNDVDFDQYRNSAVACLDLVGEVKSGEVVEREGNHYFVKRLTHSRRSKKPREPQVYLLDSYVPRASET